MIVVSNCLPTQRQLLSFENHICAASCEIVVFYFTRVFSPDVQGRSKLYKKLYNIMFWQLLIYPCTCKLPADFSPTQTDSNFLFVIVLFPSNSQTSYCAQYFRFESAKTEQLFQRVLQCKTNSRARQSVLISLKRIVGLFKVLLLFVYSVLIHGHKRWQQLIQKPMSC